MRIENLKLRVHELLNEKEDMAAMHQSDRGIKEHLIGKLNDLEKNCVEKGMELMFEKKRVRELTEEKDQYADMLEKAEKEVKEYKTKMSKEVKGMRENVNNLGEENQAYKKVIEEMSIFFRKIVYE